MVFVEKDVGLIVSSACVWPSPCLRGMWGWYAHVRGPYHLRNVAKIRICESRQIVVSESNQ